MSINYDEHKIFEKQKKDLIDENDQINTEQEGLSKDLQETLKRIQGNDNDDK